ncbi:MAG: CoA transferase [Mycetocola sp.]
MTDTNSAPRPTALFASPITVVELGESVSTAISGRLLLKMGANVTRILPAGTFSAIDSTPPFLVAEDEPPSALAVWLHEGKTLWEPDLSDPAIRLEVLAVLKNADVILIWGTTDEWASRGLPLTAVSRAAPTAVIGHVTAWGDDGPYGGFRQGELTLQATSGFLNLLGVIDREPVRLAGHPIQSVTGMLALDGILIGLFRRQSTGQGARFDTSEFESAAHLEWKIATFVQSQMRRELRGEDGGGPCVVRCRDGHFAMFFMPRHWEDMKTIIGDPRLDEDRFATATAREEHLDELVAVVEETTLLMSKKELYYQAQAKNIPAGYVATVTDLRTSPQYRARNLFNPITVEGIGTGELPSAPWQVLTTSNDGSGVDAA